MPTDAQNCRACRVLRLLALAGYSAIILWLSLTPHPPQLSGDFIGWDKAQHAAAYGGLTWLGGRALELYLAPPVRAWLVATLFALLFGGLVELAQGAMTQVRFADPQDLLANAIGTVAIYAWARSRCREGKG